MRRSWQKSGIDRRRPPSHLFRKFNIFIVSLTIKVAAMRSRIKVSIFILLGLVLLWVAASWFIEDYRLVLPETAVFVSAFGGLGIWCFVVARKSLKLTHVSASNISGKSRKIGAKLLNAAAIIFAFSYLFAAGGLLIFGITPNYENIRLFLFFPLIWLAVGMVSCCMTCCGLLL